MTYKPGRKAAAKPRAFMSMRGATLKNGKKVHTIFGVTSIKDGKATSRKNGFYAVYCNRSDAPGRKPDSRWNGEETRNLKAYWVTRSDVKPVDGARKQDGSVFIETKADLDAFCGKNMTEY